MSNKNVASEGLINLVKSVSTRLIFSIFVVLIVLVSFLFFVTIERQQTRVDNEIINRSTYRTEIKELKNKISEECQKSVNSSLLFNISKKEIDRFQTIYSLKTTSDLYNEFFELTAYYDQDEDVKNSVQELKIRLSDFDQIIAESINKDGKLMELIGQSMQSDSTFRDGFMFADSLLGGDVAEAKALTSLQDEISNQLFLIDNKIEMLTESEIEDLGSRTPVATYVVFVVVFVLLLLFLGYLIAIKLTNSVADMSSVLGHIAHGELPKEDNKGYGEFGEIAEASNELVRYLDDASQFAIKIGDGDFNYEFKPKSEHDALGNSLIEMRDRLQEVAEQDKIRNWINEGQAKFGEILRKYNQNVEALGSNTIVQLVEYLNASQGTIFLLKEEDSEQYLQLLSAYAFQRKKYLDKRIEIGEGLIGQAYEEGKTIHLTDIKTDHFDIQTGLGTSKPSSLLIIPLKNEDGIEGVVELASFDNFEKHQIEFVEQIGSGIASSLRAGKISETTKKLLDDSQEKAETMRAQEEELRQNMEELAATQEQVERRNSELETTQKQLNEERYLLNALLNMTTDRIYFKDKRSRFIRVSQSMVKLFNKKEESDIIGKSDFDFGFTDHAKKAYSDEQDIIRTGIAMEDAVEMEKWDDGTTSWVSTTKNPLKNHEGETVGTFGISRDITKSRTAELETYKRKEWLDYFFAYNYTAFVVIDQRGVVNFVTRGILTYLKKKEVGGLVFEDVFKDKSFEEFLVDIDFSYTKDSKIDISLMLNSKTKKAIDFQAVSASKVNEDGSQNIFLIQK